MKAIALATGALLGFCNCAGGEPPPLRLATTTSVKDSGLLDELLPAFRERTGIELGVFSVGTGLALRLAEHGEADAVITHDRKREEAFVAAGHARERRVFAVSDFLIVGPAGDPAGIRGSDAATAFRRIASAGATFASRGDSSGTHARELRLWETAHVARPVGPAYVEVRAGMAVTLQFADERGAYALTDRATFLAHAERLRLKRLVEGDPRLENPYAVMVVDPARHPEADSRRALVFADWLFSDEARGIISRLSRSGEPLFRLPAEKGVALTVSAAVSLKELLEEVAPAFEEANPSLSVRLNLAASGELQRQIEGGAPVDVFISASSRILDRLVEGGSMTAQSRRDIACNRLVVITPPDRTGPRELGQLRGLRRIAIGNPRTVPAGEYAREALMGAGLWEELEPRLIFAESVRQALEYVARGEVEAGFVYATDVRVVPEEVRLAFEVDPASHAPIVYPAAVATSSEQPELAEGFVEFLAGEHAAEALRRHGFTRPPCEVR